jgi:hypothetical protein
MVEEVVKKGCRILLMNFQGNRYMSSREAVLITVMACLALYCQKLEIENPAHRNKSDYRGSELLNPSMHHVRQCEIGAKMIHPSDKFEKFVCRPAQI